MAGLSKPRFNDLGLLNRDQKLGISFFPAAPPPLNKADIPKLVTEAAKGCSKEEIEVLVRFVGHMATQIPAPHVNHVKQIVLLCLSGTKAIPAYHPPKPSAAPQPPADRTNIAQGKS